MASYTQQNKDRDIPLKGLNYSAEIEAAQKQAEDERWQRSLRMADMAAKMDPYTSLGFSLGNLLFSNIGNWFGGGNGGRNSDGTKHDSAAGAAGTTDSPDFSRFQTTDPMQMLANAGDPHAQFVLDAEANNPLRYTPQPGSFGSPEYAAANGISIQKDTLAPTDNGQGVQATSTTFSTNNPMVLTGGPYFAAPAGMNQGGLNTTFNRDYSIENSLVNGNNWHNTVAANGGAGLLSTNLNLDDPEKKNLYFWR